MNYLAHLFFTDDDKENVVGNFIADAVKGSKINTYSEKIISGIKMHRAIDTFTDNHDVVKHSIQALRPHFRKYSPVVSDLYYDHFLSKNWNEYYPNNSVETFTKSKLAVIEEFIDIIPERSARMFNYLKANNRLVTYRDYDGLNMTFVEMSKRVSFVSNLENAADFLFENYDLFESDFKMFFVDLIAFVEGYKYSFSLE